MNCIEKYIYIKKKSGKVRKVKNEYHRLTLWDLKLYKSPTTKIMVKGNLL
jgi:hypothetical protein